MEKSKFKDALSSDKAKAGILTATFIGSGVAGAAAASMFDTEESDIEIIDEGLSVAEDVNDKMSFSEAFEAARAEVGPGGLFHWHGNTYNTFTEKEWTSMSEEERQEFANRIGHEADNDNGNYGSSSHHHDSNDDTVAQVVSGSLTDAQDQHQDNQVSEQNHDIYEPTQITDVESEPGTTTEAEPSVSVFGIEDVVQDDDSVVTIAAINVNGHDAVLLDVDHNGTFDVGGIDINHNGILESEESFDVSQSGLTIEDLAEVNQGETHLLTPTEEPYVNDISNVSSTDYLDEGTAINSNNIPEFADDNDYFA